MRVPVDALSRRRLLNRLCLSLGGVASAIVGIPVIAYLLSPLLEPAANVWRDVGGVGQFPVGETAKVVFEDPSPLPWAGQTAKTAAWLRHSEEGFAAFAINCTHLGCPVSWLPDAQLFLCPCHGGVFDANGDVVGGPPPRPLWRLDVRVRDGRVEVLTKGLQVG
jgi:menaquinol-cytochrome c reductase iron-sulfur subunit